MATATIDRYGTVSVDTQSWLDDRLEYDAELDGKYQRYASKLCASDGTYGIRAAERFIDSLDRHADMGERWTYNTYNDESALDSILQFAWFEIEEDSFLPAGTYVLLQRHYGGDARGNYDYDAKLYLAPPLEDWVGWTMVSVACNGGIVPRADGAITGQIGMDGNVIPEPTPEYHSWYSDDGGYSFHSDDSYNGYSTLEFEESSNGNALAATYDDDTDTWLCPVCNAALSARSA